MTSESKDSHPVFETCCRYSCLFVVREVNARVLGRGLKLLDGNDNEWELNQLLFVDDTVVVADSGRKLCQLVTEFGRVCERRKFSSECG